MITFSIIKLFIFKFKKLEVIMNSKSFWLVNIAK